MKNKLFAFTINTIDQAEKIILEAKIYKVKPIIHIKNYLVKGLGSDFIYTFQNMLISKFGEKSFKLYVDCGLDNSLSISMIVKKINYVKLRSSPIVLTKINNIASKNRVLLNPSFNIVDFRNRKNIKSKIQKIYSRNKNEN